MTRYYHCCRHCGFEPLEGMDAYLSLHGEAATCITCSCAFDARERAVLALMQCMEHSDHDTCVQAATAAPDCTLGHTSARVGCTWLSFFDIDARLYISDMSDRRSLWLADAEGIFRVAHDIGAGA